MYSFINWLKNQGQSGYTSPEEIARALNSASDDKFQEETKAFELNETISSDLRNFKKKSTVSLTSGSGTVPSDFKYATNASTTGNKSIEIVPEGEWVNKLNDPIDVPDANYPICAIRDVIEVVPTSISSMYLYYLREPATMTITYSTDGDGNVTVTGGVDCDWPELTHTDIVRRALVYLGIPINDEGISRLEMYKKQTEAA